MWRIISIFFFLHGFVHLLYFGHSAGYFKLQPGMTWPDGAWAFSRMLDSGATRSLASVLLIIAALGFVVGGIALFIRQPWWRPTIIAVAAFSSLVYLLMWDGGLQHLDNQGGVGILFNMAFLAATLIFQWPKV
jgi:hypothetical protein